MTDDLADPSTDLANLDAENDARLKRLLPQTGPLPPNLFENIRFQIYLEALLKEFRLLEDAKLEFANAASAMIDQLDKVIVEAKIRAGTGIKPEDLDNIVKLHRG